ncbi:hypothetical protein FCOIX_11050 [Fusarium coicis]|nr:hypothetical protein FCOIX_11050 [Fusarium coicis]
MAPKPPHRKRRNNSKTPSQGSPCTPPPESTTAGSSLPQTPWSSDYEEQDTASRSGSSPSALENADASSSRVASQLPTNGAKSDDTSDDTSDDNGYVRETILLSHLKVIWSWIRFLGSYWKAITSVLLTISVVAIYISIRYFDECNEWLTENDLPVMPSLEELNAMIGYTFFVYFSGVFIIFILGLAAWCSIDWKRIVSTETRRAYPLNAVKQLAAFAKRYRGNDILAFCIFRTSYYVTYYYFACAHYFFPEKYEYNIWHDQVALFITGLVVAIALGAIVIGKIFDWVMRNADNGKKMRDI